MVTALMRGTPYKANNAWRQNQTFLQEEPKRVRGGPTIAEISGFGTLDMATRIIFGDTARQRICGPG